MKKRFLPIPLILLTPIVLLIVVVAAGVYRFSLSDEEILAKFPKSNVQIDTIAQQVFGLRLTNPITVPVPDTHSVAFMERWDKAHRWTLGDYDTGTDRGSVALDTELLTPIDGEDKSYVSVVTVSNQGSGVFTYLALFKFDEHRARMVMVESELLGDRVKVQSIKPTDNKIEVILLIHTKNQPFSESPTESVSILFSITDKYQLVRN